MKMDEKKIKTLIKMSGGVCPNCGSTDYEIISSFTTNISGSTTTIKKCKNCGCEWRVYKIKNGLPIFDGIVKRGKPIKKLEKYLKRGEK